MHFCNAPHVRLRRCLGATPCGHSTRAHILRRTITLASRSYHKFWSPPKVAPLSRTRQNTPKNYLLAAPLLHSTHRLSAIIVNNSYLASFAIHLTSTQDTRPPYHIHLGILYNAINCFSIQPITRVFTHSVNFIYKHSRIYANISNYDSPPFARTTSDYVYTDSLMK